MQKFTSVGLAILFLLISLPVVAKGKAEAPGQQKNASAMQEDNKQDKHLTVGSVSEVKKNAVVVEEKKNKQKIETVIDADTKIIGLNKKEIKLGAVKLKDIMALVSTQSGETATVSGKFKVKKIFVKHASESAQMKRKAVQGVIVDMSGNLLTVAHQIQRGRTYQVFTTPQTIITFKEKIASDSASSSEATGSASAGKLAVGQRIVAVGDLNPAGGIIAKRIHVIPGKAVGIFRRLPVATPSASMVASPSAVASSSALPASSPQVTPLPSILPTPEL